MPRDGLVRVSEKKRWTQYMIIFCKSVTLNPQTHTEFSFYCNCHTQVDSLSSFIVFQPIFLLQHLQVFQVLEVLHSIVCFSKLYKTLGDEA